MADYPPGVTLRMRIPVHEFAERVSAVAWSCDGQRLATAFRKGADVWAIDTDSWASHLALSIDKGSTSNSSFVMWSPTDPDVLVKARGGMMTLLRIDGSGRSCSHVWECRYGSNVGLMPAMSFSPTGDRIAVAHGDTEVSIIDASTGDVAYTRSIDSVARYVRWSPDNSRILAFQDSPEAVIFPASSDSSGHASLVQDAEIDWAAWAPNGRLLCTNDDRTVRVWDVAGKLRTVLEGHTDLVVSIQLG